MIDPQDSYYYRCVMNIYNSSILLPQCVVNDVHLISRILCCHVRYDLMFMITISLFDTSYHPSYSLLWSLIPTIFATPISIFLRVDVIYHSPRHLHVRFFISLFFMIFFISLVSIIFRCYDSLKRIFLGDTYLRNTHNWILTNNPSNRRIIHLSMKHKKPVRMIILCDVSVSIMFLIFGDLKSL